jgi:hypothetical protein
MPVSLPIDDPTPNELEVEGIEATYEPGVVSLTQTIVEKVMAADFPTVAMLGIEHYAQRLSRVVYTDGFQVFWLDRLPELPGYTVAALEGPTTTIGEDGGMRIAINYLTGPAAARRAEEMRRRIAPL